MYELHLPANPLTRSQVRRIKACGGDYSETRGNAMRRFVTVPSSERELIDELVRTHAADTTKPVVIVARHDARISLPAWVVVQRVNPHADESPSAQFARKYDAALRDAEKRNLVYRPVTTEAQP